MRAADFAARTVYVVGGSLGIGLAVAKRVAGLGARVCVFARRAEPLARAVEDIRAVSRATPPSVWAWAVDVRDREAVARTMDKAVEGAGPPDVLINCAGRAIPHRFEDVPVEQLADTMAVNLFGCWYTIRALLPHLKARGRGYIVNTSSLAGLIGVFGYTDYSASKFALVGFSEALRSELKLHGIAVSVLCPPDTDTPGLAAENATKPPETHAVSAGARVMSAEAVAAALLRGMEKESFLILPGREARMAALAKRLLPGLVERTMDRAVRRARRRLPVSQ